MEKAREALAPFIKPRDEVAHIRKILGAHLDACLESGGNATGVRKPLSLVDLPAPVTLSPEVRGLQREYLKALNANLKARREYEAAKAREGHHCQPTESRGPASGGILEDHMLSLKLRKKQQRLQAITKCLDLLNQMPAASPDFLDPGQIFRDCPPLPDVPKDAVSSFVLDKTLSQASLDELLDRLQKTVLRARLLLRREEQLLDEVKNKRSSARRTDGQAGVDGSKLSALTATRDELISWMEMELAKASGEGSAESKGGPSGRARQMAESRAHVDEQLSAIKHKYDEYLAARKALLQLVSQKRQPTLKPPMDPPASASIPEASRLGPTPSQAAHTYLHAPYLERLLAISHEQKGLIAHKSHFNVSLAKQTKDTCQSLDHLAEESQLLPKYPMRGAHSRQLLGDNGGLSGIGSSGPEDSTVSSRAQRWVFAAESAKIATLENVAGRTEEWEMALDGSTRHLGEIDRLLGRQSYVPGDEISLELEAGGEGSDIWLSQNQPPSDKGAGAESKRQDGKAKKAGIKTDVWAALDGDLGLIRDETVAN